METRADHQTEAPGDAPVLLQLLRRFRVDRPEPRESDQVPGRKATPDDAVHRRAVGTDSVGLRSRPGNALPDETGNRKEAPGPRSPHEAFRAPDLGRGNPYPRPDQEWQAVSIPSKNRRARMGSPTRSCPQSSGGNCGRGAPLLFLDRERETPPCSHRMAGSFEESFRNRGSLRPRLT